MKGISPLIASILLIAFTVAVGGLVSLWISGYTKTQTSQITTTSQDQVQCYNSVMAIKSSVWTNSTGILQVTVGYDSGTLNLNNPVIDAACSAQSNTNASTSVASVVPGGVFVVQLNMGSQCWPGSTPDFERVRAICIGPSTSTNFTIATECRKGQGCGL